MDNNSVAQQLYEFLNNYNLIQSNLTEEENLNLIANALDQLNENENILTGFISKLNESDKSEKAILLTDNNRIILSSGSGQETISIGTDNIDSISIEDAPNFNKLVITTDNSPIEIFTDNEEGLEAINDALYSALSEIKSASQINKIFNLEPDMVIEETVEEPKPAVSEPTSFDDLTKPVDSFESSLYEPLPTGTSPYDFSDQFETSAIEPEEKAVPEDKNYFNIFNHKIKKSTAYIIAGVGILVIAALIFFIATSFSDESKANKEARQLVEIFNQIDDIYFIAVDYEENPEGITAEDWQKLDNSAIDIQNSLNDFSTNEISDGLYQAIYFYNDSLMTALYYGQSYATTGNELQKNTLKQRLDSAYQNRLAVISVLDNNFPDLLKLVTHGSTKDNSIEDLLNETNSNGSDMLNKENTLSSDESRENSLTSDEIIDYSKYKHD